MGRSDLAKTRVMVVRGCDVRVISCVSVQSRFGGETYWTKLYEPVPNLRIVLRSEGKLVHLEQPMTLLPYLVASQAARDAYEALYDAQNKVACLMLGSMSPELQMH
ncbi:hypothetical protein Tco_1128419 [Tanacetum coccineum]